jgi:hypothetical protein
VAASFFIILALQEYQEINGTLMLLIWGMSIRWALFKRCRLGQGYCTRPRLLTLAATVILTLWKGKVPAWELYTLVKGCNTIKATLMGKSHGNKYHNFMFFYHSDVLSLSLISWIQPEARGQEKLWCISYRSGSGHRVKCRDWGCGISSITSKSSPLSIWIVGKNSQISWMFHWMWFEGVLTEILVIADPPYAPLKQPLEAYARITVCVISFCHQCFQHICD